MSFPQTILPSKFWAPTSQAAKAQNIPGNVKSSCEELGLGVWRVLVMKDPFFSAFGFQWKGFSTGVVLFLHVLYDVYIVSPRLFALCIMAQFWSAIESPLMLYLSNRLFFCIEKRISGGSANDQTSLDLYWAVISRVACSAFSTYVKWSSRHYRHAYASRVKYEYQARIFAARLAFDFQTAQDMGESKIHSDDVFRGLERGIAVINEATSFLLHLRLIVHVIGSGFNDGGPVFLALCMLPSLMRHLSSGELWTKAYVVSAANKFFIRKSALERLSRLELKQEVMAGCVNEYLTNEYRKAKDGLGDTSDTPPEVLYGKEREVLSDLMMTLCSDGPMLYFAFLALVSPSKLSVIQLAVLDQASTSLRYTFESLTMSISFLPGELSRMMNIYSILHTSNRMEDGETAFPRPGYDASQGMSIQVQDVSFSYPNTRSDRAALTSVSFTIQPGQLVVIVGANGSGKSTIIKLLSRFYDVTSGNILIDGIPIEKYKMNELRKGVAMLTQEHQLFPLSVQENIRLGSSELEVTEVEGKIRASVSATGAEGIVKNFSDGYDTVLQPATNAYVSYAGQGNKELEAIYKKLEKPTSISGGEKQKLVAARTFMRLFTSPVKLVTVDEPSSALDPEAEYRLFKNLRQERQGRTMIFVTHRFGHLTKYADLIICLKEGTVVETGTHADLLSKDGEYARLYDVQAQAFMTT